jgi:hypothetical protein
MKTEMLRCHKCRQWYEAHSDDLGTYFCQRCEKPKIFDYAELERFVATMYANHMKKIKAERENKTKEIT